MKLSHKDVRSRFRQFWLTRDHKEVPPIPLVPKDDPTTLFTGSGMQQFIPNLLGEPHPLGKQLFNIQPCIRVQDIDEVGDNRHTTCFEMVGNWSLGTYFKKVQLENLFQFLTSKEEGLGLPVEKLYITVFQGDDQIPKDTESIEIWKKLFGKHGLKAELGERIQEYDAKKNWWSRSGIPLNMPVNEPGGPDSEVFYDFGREYQFHEKSIYKNQNCHLNCDCGRYIEIANSVFMMYKKRADGTFSQLPQKNVDFGGGFERFICAVNATPDIFQTDLYLDTVSLIERLTNSSYTNVKHQRNIRIIADHIKGAVFILFAGVEPSNKEQGYVLRRLLRRSIIKLHELTGTLPTYQVISQIANSIYSIYQSEYFHEDFKPIETIIQRELAKFTKSLEKGLKQIKKINAINSKLAFDLYQSFGFPLEITEELFHQKGQKIDKIEFYNEFNKHKELSRSSATGKFKGGLADHSEQVVKYHTATHLLHQALFDVLGPEVSQQGSNITSARLRFDYTSPNKLTKEQLHKVEEIINNKITESLPVRYEIIPKNKAFEIGARAFFKEKYPDMVKVYFVGDYSKEFCGGPHVENTKSIGKIEIYKYEKIGSQIYRIYAR